MNNFWLTFLKSARKDSRFSHFLPSRRRLKINQDLVLPAFNIQTPVWLGSSYITLEFHGQVEKNFAFRNYPLEFNPIPNFCLAVRDITNDPLNVRRFKLYDSVNELLSYPVYNGETISKNFALEIWSTMNSLQTSLDSEILIPISILDLPIDCCSVEGTKINLTRVCELFAFSNLDNGGNGEEDEDEDEEEETPPILLNLVAYFNLDQDPTDGIAHEIINNNNLLLTTFELFDDWSGAGGNPAQINGIISNAFNMGPAFGLGAEFYSIDPAYEFAGQDWAIRFWFKRNPAIPGGGNMLQRGSIQPFPENLNNGWEVASGTGFTPRRIQLYVGDGSSQTNVFDTLGADFDGEWHRVVIWNRSGVEIGIKLDNKDSVTEEMLNPMSPCNIPLKPGPLLFNYWNFFMGLDEIAMWKGYIPTEAELLYDWNGGAGRTYPDLVIPP